MFFVSLSFSSSSLVVPDILTGPMTCMGNRGSCSGDLQENCCVEGVGTKSTSPFFSYLGNIAGSWFVLGRSVLYQMNLVQHLPIHMLFLHASFQVTWKCEFRACARTHTNTHTRTHTRVIYMYQFIKYMYIFYTFNL